MTKEGRKRDRILFKSIERIIKGKRLGIMEWNHKSSPADAPDTVVCGFKISRRKNRIKKIRKSSCFIKWLLFLTIY
mgnify:CR=1 FL=1